MKDILDKKCEDCSGTGEDAASGHPCVKCGGQGFILTELGVHLLAFIKRHKDLLNE